MTATVIDKPLSNDVGAGPDKLSVSDKFGIMFSGTGAPTARVGAPVLRSMRKVLPRDAQIVLLFVLLPTDRPTDHIPIPSD